MFNKQERYCASCYKLANSSTLQVDTSNGSDAFARKYGGVKFVDKHPNHVADAVEELISDNMSHYNELRKEIKPYLVGQDYSPQKIVSSFDKIRLSGHS